jgi:hypothetical protein
MTESKLFITRSKQMGIVQAYDSWKVRAIQRRGIFATIPDPQTNPQQLLRKERQQQVFALWSHLASKTQTGCFLANEAKKYGKPSHLPTPTRQNMDRNTQMLRA